jgi:hypothetical protein
MENENVQEQQLRPWHTAQPETRAKESVPGIVTLLQIIGWIEAAASVVCFFYLAYMLNLSTLTNEDYVSWFHPAWLAIAAAGGLLNSVLWFALAFGLKCLDRIAHKEKS